MKADEFLTELTRLEMAARMLGFSVAVAARLNSALNMAIQEKRQMDCPHTLTISWTHTHAAGRDEVTSCKECSKEISREAR